ncbi:MAG TPA: Ppx/GppA family phosphatase [Deltaproteobacteria bacterium]|nr:Ppx/GppA family phosphatase [Deltaproteobacteria bacterium]
MRVAAIDVGTNSVHLLIADVGPDGEVSVVEKTREQVELGRGGLDRNLLTDDAMRRGVDAMIAIREAMDSLGVETADATATSAVREAQNGSDFVRSVREATGIHVRVISGLDEARLIYLGVRPELDFSRGYALLIDVGGGSIELILCDATRILAAHSLPLGHLRLTDAFVDSDPPTPEALSRVRAHTHHRLRSVLADIPPGVAGTLVGTGGSVRTLARMATLMRGEPEPQHSHGLVLNKGDLKRLATQLAQVKQARLSDIPGMDSRRKATLPAAAAALHQIMKTFDHDRLVTSDRSLRDGLLANWILRNEPELALSRTVVWPRMRSVLRLMERYEADQAHCTQVRDLALVLFDSLSGLKLDSSARRTLEYAALLHDIGHHIDARDHHKHGQYLILNSRMAGFTAPEVAVVANIVRHHRKRPKRSDHHFAALPRSDQRKVEILSAILRVADALDRSHNQPVIELEAEDDGTSIHLLARTQDEAHIERWAAERRVKGLSSALGRPVTIELQPAESSVNPPAEGAPQVE